MSITPSLKEFAEGERQMCDCKDLQCNRIPAVLTTNGCQNTKIVPNPRILHFFLYMLTYDKV